ncbi:GIY-YIG nuclease family protein [Verrucomicrobiota bacterium]
MHNFQVRVLLSGKAPADAHGVASFQVYPAIAGLVTREMSFFVYILYSASSNLYYSGFSKYRGKRQRQHRAKGNNWASRINDWKEVYCQKEETREKARQLEKKIKARGAKRFLSDKGLEKR